MSRKESKALSKDTQGSKNSKNSLRSRQHQTKVEEYVNLKTPTMKQTLELFKEKVDQNDVNLLISQVKSKREENKSLLKKIQEAESMLKNLEIRQERAKQVQKRKSKLYRSKAIGAIRKIGSVPGKKTGSLDFIKTIKKQMKERERASEKMMQNQKSKELKKKQRKAIENIIKEGIENEKLRKRLNDALKRFTQKLDDGQINSQMMDEELERILDLRRVAQMMGVQLFGEDLEEEEIRELYRQKDYRVFKPNEHTVNQSAFFDQDSLDAIDELGGYGGGGNRSMHVGRKNSSMNIGGSRVRRKTKNKRFLQKSQNILGNEGGNSKFWKSLKKSKSKKKTKKPKKLGKSGVKLWSKNKKNKKTSSKIKTRIKSGRVYNTKKKNSKSKSKRNRSVIKR